MMKYIIVLMIVCCWGCEKKPAFVIPEVDSKKMKEINKHNEKYDKAVKKYQDTLDKYQSSKKALSLRLTVKGAQKRFGDSLKDSVVDGLKESIHRTEIENIPVQVKCRFLDGYVEQLMITGKKGGALLLNQSNTIINSLVGKAIIKDLSKEKQVHESCLVRTGFFVLIKSYKFIDQEVQK